MITRILARLRCQQGQDLIEYAMLSGLIAIAILGAAFAFDAAFIGLSDGISECIDFDGVDCQP